jgi:taurine--2-oxoglutarate transaminase
MAMTNREIVELSRKYTVYEWTPQAHSAVDPVVAARSQGVYFWDADGKRYIDFNSQLMCVNAGHGDERIVNGIIEQLRKMPYANPFLATEPRARLGQMLAELTPGNLNKLFFTNGGAEANENAIKLARHFTGRHKIIARYRSYHGATHGAISLTGDPRRWAAEPAIPGIVRVLDPYPYRCSFGSQSVEECGQRALAHVAEVIQYEGPQTIAAMIIETVTGTNGLLVPPPGYLEGLRKLCDQHGILLVCDEVMSGFGRTGKWFACEHWNVVPDIITMAKGLTSAYLPLGAVAMKEEIAAHFEHKAFPGGLTYNCHPMGLASAIATIDVYKQDRLIERAAKMGEVMKAHHAKLKEKHRSVGDVRSIGLFGIVELVRDRATKEPLAPFNGTSPEMQKLGRYFRDHGLYTFVRWNNFFTNPPLSITEAEMAEGFEIIDQGLSLIDGMLGG